MIETNKTVVSKEDFVHRLDLLFCLSFIGKSSHILREKKPKKPWQWSFSNNTNVVSSNIQVSNGKMENFIRQCFFFWNFENFDVIIKSMNIELISIYPDVVQCSFTRC